MTTPIRFGAIILAQPKEFLEARTAKKKLDDAAQNKTLTLQEYQEAVRQYPLIPSLELLQKKRKPQASLAQGRFNKYRMGFSEASDVLSLSDGQGIATRQGTKINAVALYTGVHFNLLKDAAKKGEATPMARSIAGFTRLNQWF